MTIIQKNSKWLYRIMAVLTAGLLGLYLTGCGPSLPKSKQRVKPGRAIPSTKAPKTAYPLSGKSYTINGQEYMVLASAQSYVEEGIASWYGRDFHGRKTASAEKYDMYSLTAAHKILPLQTWVTVTNMTNNIEVTVRINDRGPFVRGRIIDLSYTAARRIGLVGPGTAWVRVEALGKAEERTIDGKVTTVLVKPASYTEGRFTVQVGSFKEKSNANTLVRNLKKRYDRVRIEVFELNGLNFYRVQVEEKNTIGQALALQKRLEKEGFRDCFIVAR